MTTRRQRGHRGVCVRIGQRGARGRIALEQQHWATDLRTDLPFVVAIEPAAFDDRREHFRVELRQAPCIEVQRLRASQLAQLGQAASSGGRNGKFRERRCQFIDAGHAPRLPAVRQADLGGRRRPPQAHDVHHRRAPGHRT